MGGRGGLHTSSAGIVLRSWKQLTSLANFVAGWGAAELEGHEGVLGEAAADVDDLVFADSVEDEVGVGEGRC